MKVLCQEQYFWDKDSCPIQTLYNIGHVTTVHKTEGLLSQNTLNPSNPLSTLTLPLNSSVQIQYQYFNTNLQKKHCLKLSSIALLVNCDGQHELLLPDYHTRSKRNWLSYTFHYCNAEVCYVIMLVYENSFLLLKGYYSKPCSMHFHGSNFQCCKLH